MVCLWFILFSSVGDQTQTLTQSNVVTSPSHCRATWEACACCRRPKCNKLRSVISFGLKCNNVIPTSSVMLLTCCWLLVVISCVIGHIIKKVSEHLFSGLSRDWRRHHTKLRISLSDFFLSRAFCKLSQSMKLTSLLATQWGSPKGSGALGHFLSGFELPGAQI